MLAWHSIQVYTHGEPYCCGSVPSKLLRFISHFITTAHQGNKTSEGTQTHCDAQTCHNNTSSLWAGNGIHAAAIQTALAMQYDIVHVHVHERENIIQHVHVCSIEKESPQGSHNMFKTCTRIVQCARIAAYMCIHVHVYIHMYTYVCLLTVLYTTMYVVWIQKHTHTSLCNLYYPLPFPSQCACICRAHVVCHQYVPFEAVPLFTQLI